MEIIAKRKQFTVEDLEKEVNFGTTVLMEVLDTLSGEGVIGDMGSYYWVVDRS